MRVNTVCMHSYPFGTKLERENGSDQLNYLYFGRVVLVKTEKSSPTENSVFGRGFFGDAETLRVLLPRTR